MRQDRIVISQLVTILDLDQCSKSTVLVKYATTYCVSSIINSSI
ncbi:hypothetical protein [Vibrio gallaecicus]|nr:hypothetical protein [Vibrio gallaecicus]MDN3616985.1 hypothetical protein [Vibrio gallaecicus]